MRVAAAPPTPSGGAFPAGTYVMTSDVIYTGPDGGTGPTNVTYQAVARTGGSSGDTWEYSSIHTIGSAVFNGNLAGHYVIVDGGGMTMTVDCPAPLPIGVNAYDSTPTSYTLYDPTAAGGTEAITYTKQ
jgi:hypothetical protein